MDFYTKPGQGNLPFADQFRQLGIPVGIFQKLGEGFNKIRAGYFGKLGA